MSQCSGINAIYEAAFWISFDLKLSFLALFFDSFYNVEIDQFLLTLAVEKKISPHLYFPLCSYTKPARTLSINGQNSRVLKLSFFSLKMIVKSGLEFI